MHGPPVRARDASLLPLTVLVCAAGLVAILLAGPDTRAENIGKPYTLSKKYAVGERHMQVRLLGTLVLNKSEVNGISPRELSGLVWDEDAQLLYAVSDDGYLCHFAPQFSDGVLTAVDYRAAYPLRESDGTPVEDKASDSEGLAARNSHNGVPGDTELLVSFEVHPRILRYSVDGQLRGKLPLDAQFANIGNYHSRNTAIEGIALHDKYGLLFAPERPLRSADQEILTIYSSTAGAWQIIPIDPEHSAIVGLELTPHGDLLVLERRYESIFRPVIWSVRRVKLDGAAATAPQKPEEILTVTTRDSAWSPQNFEGIAHHRDNKYFMISDDGESSLQKTLLMYFEILEFDQFLTR